jgi:hypothetical protein
MSFIRKRRPKWFNKLVEAELLNGVGRPFTEVEARLTRAIKRRARGADDLAFLKRHLKRDLSTVQSRYRNESLGLVFRGVQYFADEHGIVQRAPTKCSLKEKERRSRKVLMHEFKTLMAKRRCIYFYGNNSWYEEFTTPVDIPRERYISGCISHQHYICDDRGVCKVKRKQLSKREVVKLGLSRFMSFFEEVE